MYFQLVKCQVASKVQEHRATNTLQLKFSQGISGKLSGKRKNLLLFVVTLSGFPNYLKKLCTACTYIDLLPKILVMLEN